MQKQTGLLGKTTIATISFFKMVLFVLALMLISYHPATAQNEMISPEGLLTKAQIAFDKNDFQASLKVLNQLKPIIGALNSHNQIMAKVLAGHTNRELDNLTQALEYYQSILAYFDQYDFPNIRSSVYAGMARVYNRMGNFDEAFIHGKEALVNENRLDPTARVIARKNLSGIYLYMKDYRAALQTSLQALKIAKQYDLKLEIFKIYFNLSNYSVEIAKESGDPFFWQEAERYMNLAILLGQELELNHLNNMLEFGRSRLLFEQKKLPEAEVAFTNLFAQLNKIEPTTTHARVAYYLGNIYSLTERPSKAIETYKIGLNLAENVGADQAKLLILKELYHLAAKRNEYKLAFEALEEYFNKYTIIYSEENARKIGQLETKMASDRQKLIEEEARHEVKMIQDQEEAQQRSTFYSIIIGLSAIVVIILIASFMLFRLKEKLRRSSENERIANEAKSNFLATMSHEIRTPMNGVIGMVDLLLETRINSDQKKMLETVKNSGYSLLTVINDILDFSKFEAGKLEFETIPVSIRDVIEGVSETLAPLAREKDLSIFSFVDPHIPDALISDPIRLRQILVNLAGNAVKFTEKGDIVISAELISKTDEEATLKVDVIDKGIGIPLDAQESLFEAFTQAEKSTTRKFGGTGLGLTICKKLVDMMGGTIDVESHVGEGSTFSISLTLPLAGKHKIKSDEQDFSELNILLVLRQGKHEDHLVRYLEYWDAKTTLTTDLSEAVHLIESHNNNKNSFDVIIFDAAKRFDEIMDHIQSLQKDNTEQALRFVVLDDIRGHRHSDKIKNTVYTNSDPLARSHFLYAVAVAAGRRSPIIENNMDEDSNLQTKPLATSEEAEMEGHLILLAEDNATNQFVITKQLERLGFTSIVANDGVEALELLDKHDFGLLLTDCHMPNMDGFTLTRKIREKEKKSGQSLPIIAVTASSLSAEVDKCYAAGMDNFISKPVDIKKFKVTLAKYLNRPS